MSKRPSATGAADSGGGGSTGKMPRLDQAGVVKKAAPVAGRLPLLMYKDAEPLADLEAYFNAEGGPQAVEVRVPAHCLTAANRQVRARQLWGSDVYTSDSDLVAVLMHCGFWFHSAAAPPASVAEVRAVVVPAPPRPAYASTARNSIRSRAWAAPARGCSYRVDRAWVLTRAGTSVDLAPALDGAPPPAPTFAPGHLERIVTRSAAGGGARARAGQEVTVVFNLANEPWQKYSAAAVADRGLRPHEWTSARLRTQALYLETHAERYELAREEPADEKPAAAAAAKGGRGGKAAAAAAAAATAAAAAAAPAGGGEAAAAAAAAALVPAETYRLSRCRRALTAAKTRALGVPLPPAEREALHEGLLWEEVQWGPAGVRVRGQALPLVRLQFLDTTSP